MIKESYRENGLGKKLLNWWKHLLFERLQLHQLYVGIAQENTASITLFKSAGYIECGIKKDWNYYNNSYHNEVVFQKLLMYKRKIGLAIVLIVAAFGLYFTYIFYRVFSCLTRLLKTESLMFLSPPK